jgi:CDP-diglyceride synthetase
MDLLKMVAGIIGIVIIACVLGMIYLVVNDKAIPGTLETITVAGVTGLLGLLAPSRTA